jgi:hypothetical protein
MRVATRITIRLSGSPAGEQVSGSVRPYSAADGKGVGPLLFKARPVLMVRVRLPKTYFRCAGGAGPCNQFLFLNGERVIVSVGSATEIASAIRRVTVPRRRCGPRRRGPARYDARTETATPRSSTRRVMSFIRR